MRSLHASRRISRSGSAISIAVSLLWCASTGSSHAADPPRYDTSYVSLPSTAPHGKSMVVSDVNADGILDVIVGAQTLGGTPQAAVYTLEGDGFGNFSIAHTLSLPTGVGVRALGFGDVDGDGIVDLCLANHALGNVVRAHRGRGDGSFLPAVVTTIPGSSIQCIACGDVDGDGVDDIAIAGAFASGRALATGGGAFGSAVLNQASATHAYATDLDADGAADPVWTDENSTQAKYVLSSTGGVLGPTTTLATGTTPLALRAAALDADGIVDLAICNAGNSSVSLFRGLGGGAFQGYATANIGAHAVALAIADVDGDGPNDLVAANAIDDLLSVRRGVGNGNVLPTTFTTAPRNSIAVELADFDGDQHVDVAMLADLGRCMVAVRGDGTVQFAAPQSIAGPSGLAGTVADFDGNGIADLFACAFDALQPTNFVLTPALGAGVFGAPVSSQPFVFFDAYEDAGDIDGDGDGDVLMRAQFTAHDVLVNASNTFTALPKLAIPSGNPQSSSARFADLDGDGDKDVVGLHSASPTFVATWSNAAGQFAAPVKHASGIPTHFGTIATGDVDLDGLDDVVVSASGTNFAILKSTGAGFTSTTLSFGVASGGWPRLADLDHDQLPELIVLRAVASSLGPSYLAVAKNLGGGTFAAPTITALPDGPGYTASSVELGDLDGDGTIDAAIRETNTSGALIAWALTPSATPPTFSHVYLGQATHRVHVADLDGDGRADLASGGVTASTSLPWAVVRESCAGAVGTHGKGCSGAGGFVPRFALQGCATPGGTLTLRVDRAPGGSIGLLLLGLGSAQVPIGGSGCSLGIAPLLPVSAVLPLAGAGAGGGFLVAPVGIPAGIAGATVEAQVAVADATAAAGFTTTNALTVDIE